MSLSNNFPTIAPSLNLSFALTKALDPRITFTRTTTATYYDGKTTAKAEENLLLQSQTIDNASWVPIRASITADTTIAPDGTTTADTFTADGTSGTHFINPASIGAMVAGATRTLSVFAKAGTNDFIQLAFGGDAAPYANFDLSGGTVENSASVTASIVSVGSGWYRCIVTTTIATADSSRFFMITDGTSVRGESNSLSTTVILWGAQMEFRSAVTAYTPTTTQPITNYVPVLQTAASGVARFDHNPTTGESLGLLVEEQRTNLLTYSEEFDDAAWSKTASSITANTIVAPDGALTGDKLVEDTANASHIILQSESFTSGVAYTLSIYGKEDSTSAKRYLTLLLPGTAFSGALFWASIDLSNGTIVNASGSIVGSSFHVGNGWYRFVVTATATATASGSVQIRLQNAGASISAYTGDGYSGIYIWGAQLE